MADVHAPGTIIMQSFGVEHGLDVVDPIERLRRTIRTDGPVSPAEAPAERFPMPVESAVEIETSGLVLPVESQICVRDGDGHMLEEVQLGGSRTLPEGAYCLEPVGIVKLYLLVESSLEIRQDRDSTEIEFGEPVTVSVGSCSTHEQPAATVTVTDDEEALLPAISTFGSALKTTSPERAFPTHRGHPPKVEVGDELAIPDELEPPAERLEVQVPPNYADAYAVAPLAYYLGAPVVDGPPRIAGPSWEHSLEYEGDLETGVERTLKQLFLLDCVTRTEGIYQVDLHERERLEERVDLDFGALYDDRHDRRVAAYLDVPFEQIEPVIPDWKHAAHVEPTAASAEALPYLVDDLALVRTADPEPISEDAIQTGATQGLVRGVGLEQLEPEPGVAASAGSEPLMRGSVTTDAEYVHPAEPAETIEETWVGDGTPIGASKAMPEAFENRTGRSISTGSIDISVVCNAEEMSDESDVVDDTYGSRGELPFDVTIRTDTTTDELADILAEERDFLHYVGHIDDDGFRCSDGRLDATELDEVGMDAFFLNACQSYEQGMELVRAGAIGGIVTVRDVANIGAVKIGKAVARLLNCGFPLRSALDVARDESVIGCHYIVVGDGGLSIVQPESGTPHLCEVERTDDGFELSIDLFGAYPGVGGLFTPHIDSSTKYYLASGYVPPMELTGDQLERFLNGENFPIYHNSWLNWSHDLSKEEF
jgi:hypothetical protein